jgi:hypothetical protein
MDYENFCSMTVLVLPISRYYSGAAALENTSKF